MIEVIIILPVLQVTILDSVFYQEELDIGRSGN